MARLRFAFLVAVACAAASSASRAQDEAPRLRVSFATAPGAWTPELPRLASQLELLLVAQGLVVEAREVLAPGVVTLHGRTRAPAKLSRRALEALLQQPQLQPWPGLTVLLSDADPNSRGWSLEGDLRFTLRKPEAATRDTVDLARE